MKRKTGWMLPVCVLIIVGLAATSPAGVILVDGDGSRVYISGGKFKEVSEEDTQTYIIDVNDETLTVVDDEEKAYAKGTVDEFCSEVASAMDAALEGMSEEEKAMMKQMMNMAGQGKEKEPPKVTVSKSGNGEKVAGLSTTKYTVTVDGKLYEEVWITDDAAVMKEFKQMSKLSDMSFRMGGCMGGAIGVSLAGTPETSPQYRDMLKIGFPVRVVSYEEGVADEGEKVVEVKKESIPDLEFMPPKGYRKIPFKELIGSDR
jgi:hypothetical protein